jgi:hypothetical protein
MNFDSYNSRTKLIKKIIFWSAIIGGFLALIFAPSGVSSFAQPINVCEAVGGGCVDGLDEVETGREAIVDTILIIVRWLIYVSVGLSVLFIVIGAYFMIVSNGNEERYKNGLNTARNAVLGLILSILSLTIVNLVSGLVSGFNV